MKKKNGFTLIELLAVIIILGVLMIIAIPSVTKYIDESRKNGYVSTAKSIVGGARNLIYSGELGLDDKTVTYYIDGKCISTDNGYKSPYGELEKAYVAVVLDGDNYEYYWMSVDDTNTGVATLKNANKLESDDIVGDIDPLTIEPTIGIDKRNTIIKIEGEGCTKSNPEPATRKMNTKTGKVSNPCPSVTPTIYWAINNNKLTISDSLVNGTQMGNFPSSNEFTYHDYAPWLDNSSIYEYISELEIVGTVAPYSTAYWFYSLGERATSFHADLSNLEVCNVVDMNNMFHHIGDRSQSFSLEGLDTWDTSNVMNMEQMFYGIAEGTPEVYLNLSNWTFAPNSRYMFAYTASFSTKFNLNLNNSDASALSIAANMFYDVGMNATDWSITGIEDWNTSSLTDTSYMFLGAGENAQEINFDLSGWDVSKVNNMSFMFDFLGINSTTVNINLKGWDVSGLSNSSNLSNAIKNVGQNATTVNIDLSDWNVANLVELRSDFISGVGENASSVTINLSNWNTSNARYLNGFFSGVGENATNFNIIIPRTNGNGINNTTNRLYGIDTSTYAEAPSGKQFTLAS